MLDSYTILVHENVPVHTARTVKKLPRGVSLYYLGVTPRDWSPYSPGLNPFENLWPCLKQQIFKRESNMAHVTKCHVALEHLENIAIYIWDEPDMEFVNNGLVGNVPRFLQAEIDSNGWFANF